MAPKSRSGAARLLPTSLMAAALLIAAGPALADPPDDEDSGDAPAATHVIDPNQARCLTQAIYYEAGFEPVAGREAVAQVVLNRVHAAQYPKTVCGVVYQGSTRSTGCQFTFTCDGSLYRRPAAEAWRAAESIAERALEGQIEDRVGAATHYHAVWMTPYWSHSLVRTKRIGGHVFYQQHGAAVTQSLGASLDGDESAGRRRSKRAAATPQIRRFDIGGLQVASTTPLQNSGLRIIEIKPRKHAATH
jgi:Cell Wall Hydrolase